MNSIANSIPYDRVVQLKEVDERLQITPKELVRVSVNEILSCPEEAFQRAVSYVMKKNAELYQRLS